MKKARLCSLLILFASLWSGLAWAQQPSTPAEPAVSAAATRDPGGIGRGIRVPRLIKLSGALKTVTGTPLTGTHGLTLALYKEQQDGSPIWQESQNVELDEQGR